MRRALILASGLGALALLVLFYQHHAQIVGWATGMQREFQNGLARSLRALRAGEGGAWIGLMGLCFGYGFVHAVGPGHGKFLVGAYSAARPVGLGRLSAATIAASLGQAVTALLLVLGGIGLFSWTRQQMTVLAETTMVQLSLVSVLLIGLWLVLRGARRATSVFVAIPMSPHPVPATGHAEHSQGFAGQNHNGHASVHGAHAHGPDRHGHCSSCGHAHAPSPQAIGAAANWRELASVILAIAIRPCSGAILLLVLTWQMNILAAGIAGAFAMASGTACFTLMVAVMGHSLRTGVLAAAVDSTTLRAVAASFELVAGLVVVLLAAEGLNVI